MEKQQNPPNTTEEEETVEQIESDPYQESEEIPDEESQSSQDEVTENPFGFLFSHSVTNCFTKEHKNEDDPYIFFSGNTYKGEMHEGIIHGQGEYTWTELGARYTGTFNWGNFTGTGRIEWKDGSTYEGNVVNGIRNGQGIYRRSVPKPFVYEGEWLNGLFHGQGVCYYGEQGCDHHYVGEFQKGEREGNGTMYYPNGNVYEGQWHLGKRHGHGKFTWKESGTYYIGEFKDGQMSGQGEIVYAFSAQSPSVQFVQSNRYLGHFANSLRNGQGTFYYANGAVYKGEWHDNRKNGQGTFTSRDGRVYNSEFRDGSIYQDGQLFVPTPQISLNFPLDGLLAPSESSDEVMNSLCNIYVRFLPKLRALYQQYSKIQWANDKTITALRIVGMWRFLQDKGTILEPSFRLSDADDVVHWNLEQPSIKSNEEKPNEEEKGLHSMPSTFGLTPFDLTEPIDFENMPLDSSPDPFATLFLYQLFESLVRLAHHQLRETFPDSLILQVTRFLENSIFVDDAPPENEYSVFRKSISTSTFDDIITQYSPKLLDLYLDFSGYSSGCSRFQVEQLRQANSIDPNVDVTINKYCGILTVRDLILFLGDRDFFSDEKLTVMDVLCFQKFAGVARKIEEEEETNFKKFFASFMKCKVTFVEFVQTLAFVSNKLIPFDWPTEMKFEYVVSHLDQWRPPTPPESVNGDEANEEEEESNEDEKDDKTEKSEKSEKSEKNKK